MKSILQAVAVGCLFVSGTWPNQVSAQTMAQSAIRNNFYNPYTAYSQAMNQRSLNNGARLNNRFVNQFSNTVSYNSGYGYGGYNPYGMGYGGYNPYGMGYGGYNNYGYSPYSPQLYAQSMMSGGYGAAGMNPYAASMGGAYSGGIGGGYPGTGIGGNPYDPYGYGNYGQTLAGASSLIKSYGSLAISYEQARTIREQYNQSALKTKKDRFDLDMYIKQNTPTYTEEQLRIAKVRLTRIQKLSTPGEISSGTAINVLLGDLSKYPNKKTVLEPMMLNEAVLSQLNVTKHTYGIGILRDDGKFSWPSALSELVKAEKRNDIQSRVQGLVKSAFREGNKGKIDPNVLKDVREEMEAIRTELVQKVNEVPSAQYLDAKRFLQEFYEATRALELGDGAVQAKFQRFIEGGKSVQEVVDYMVSNGLHFAAATSGDDSSYRAFYSTLAAYDVAFNTHLGLMAKE